MSEKVWAVWYLKYEDSDIMSMHATQKGAEAARQKIIEDVLANDWVVKRNDTPEKMASHRKYLEDSHEVKEYEVENP